MNLETFNWQNFNVRPISQASSYPCKSSKSSKTEVLGEIKVESKLEITSEHESYEESQNPVEIQTENVTEKEIPKGANKKFCQKAKSPCGNKNERSSKGKKCLLSYSRTWAQGTNITSSKPNFAKALKRRKKGTEFDGECKGTLDKYERELRLPICKPRARRHVEKTEGILDEGHCLICLKSLYTGGYLYSLHQKVPLIKKQSEEYKDEVAKRIGIKTRITVHKKCYKSYIDKLSHKVEPPEEEVTEMVCFGGEAKEDSIESISKGKQKGHKRKSLRKHRRFRVVQNQNFCLKPPPIPKLDSGES